MSCCDGKGFVMARPKGKASAMPTVFRCIQCQNQVSKSIPAWTADKLGAYEREDGTLTAPQAQPVYQTKAPRIDHAKAAAGDNDDDLPF